LGYSQQQQIVASPVDARARLVGLTDFSCVAVLDDVDSNIIIIEAGGFRVDAGEAIFTAGIVRRVL